MLVYFACTVSICAFFSDVLFVTCLVIVVHFDKVQDRIRLSQPLFRRLLSSIGDLVVTAIASASNVNLYMPITSRGSLDCSNADSITRKCSTRINSHSSKKRFVNITIFCQP